MILLLSVRVAVHLSLTLRARPPQGRPVATEKK
jgi:hypothetical protein